ncbi:hypothetical protein KCU65_g254, partial [Aureobasidium melanogenum]
MPGLSNTREPTSDPPMAQENKEDDANASDEKRSDDEALETEDSPDGDQNPSPGSTGDGLANRLDAIEDSIAGIKIILEIMNKTLSTLRTEVMGARPSSNVQIVPRTDFKEQSPVNPVPIDHPAFNFVALFRSSSSRRIGYPAIGHVGGGFITAQNHQLARFDEEGRVFDMTPRNSPINYVLDLSDR